MANDGQIVFEVTADGKHAIADIKAITKAIQQETGKWDTAAKTSADNINNNFSSILKKLTAGFSAAKIGKALLDIGKDAVAAASDLQEVQNVVDTTFGSNSGKIDTWAKNASKQFGLTETMAKKFTSTMGAMLKSSGLVGDEIVNVSTDLAGLAADMSSFYNLDFEEAFAKIRSGISGQTMPLKEIGIDLSVDTLNAYALAQGLQKTFSQMTQGEQVMLRYQYLMQATADAQGDFAKTSDGYANGLRLLESNLNSLKTNLGKEILPFVNDIVQGINKLFPEEERNDSILHKIAEIQLKKDEKIAEINAIKTEAESLIELLEKIGVNPNKPTEQKNKDDETKAEEKLVQDLLALGQNSEEAVNGLLALGYTTDEIEQKQATWLQTCRRLASIIPGLSSIIDTNTGEIKGGIPALKEYADEWERTAKYQAEIEAIRAAKDVYNTNNNQAELNATAAQTKATAFAKQKVAQFSPDDQVIRKTLDDTEEVIKRLIDSGAVSFDSVWNSVFNPGNRSDLFGDNASLKKSKEYLKNAGFDEFGGEYAASIQAVSSATDAQREAFEDYARAVFEAYLIEKERPLVLEEIEHMEEEVAEEFGKTKEEIEAEAAAAEEAAKSMTLFEKAANNDQEALTQINTLIENARQAFQDLADYAETAEQATLQAINSVAHGLDRVDYSTYKQVNDNIDKIKASLNGLEEGSDAWGKQHKELEKYNDQLITTDSIYKNLQSQADFLGDYLQNMRKAREMGVDANLLAELSDGSVESAQYLDALVNGQTGTTIEQINEKYREITEAKEELAKELTDQQLSVDQTFQSLADKAAEAVAALEQAGAAKGNAENTVRGVIEGINAELPGVEEAVNSILAQLDRLSGYNVTIDFGGFGQINFVTSTGKKAETSGRFGVDYVPRDDYLIRAHEGERLLTAQENQVWNTLLRGGRSGFDLDDLGGVMRDNVKPGGNVYLDGKIVGNVVSDMQGKSYRQLKRSGWQS